VKAKTSSLLSRPVAGDFVGKLFEDLKSRLLIDLEKDSSITRDAVNEVLSSFSAHLSKNREAQAHIDITIDRLSRWAAEEYSPAIIRLITETVEGWEAKTLIQKIENEVGKDLQYIRINGTVVGGFIGILLHVLQLLLSA